MLGNCPNVGQSNLLAYSYERSGQSIMEQFMNKWWETLMYIVPIGLSPNVLTVLGLLSNLIVSLPLWITCPTMTEEPKRWTLVLFALGHFFYQTMDALDGAQCRRLDIESPIDEFMDHTCDSISITLVMIAFCTVFKLGNSPRLAVAMSATAFLAFFSAQYLIYVSDIMHFSALDVTEGQIVLIIWFLMRAYAFEEQKRSEVAAMITRAAFCVICVAMASKTIVNICTIANEGTIWTGTPVCNVILLILFFWWNQTVAQDEYSRIPLMIIHSLCFWKVISSLIASRLFNKESTIIDEILILPFIYIMLQKFTISRKQRTSSLYCILISCLLNGLVYCIDVLHCISKTINMPILTVPHRTKEVN